MPQLPNVECLRPHFCDFGSVSASNRRLMAVSFRPLRALSNSSFLSRSFPGFHVVRHRRAESIFHSKICFGSSGDVFQALYIISHISTRFRSSERGTVPRTSTADEQVCASLPRARFGNLLSLLRYIFVDFLQQLLLAITDFTFLLLNLRLHLSCFAAISCKLTPMAPTSGSWEAEFCE